jgi:membrane-bound ClpP family serine protease
MSFTVIAALIIIGLIFLLLEILVVPGTTVVGIVGFILMGIGIWQTYIVYGVPIGHYVLGGSLVLTIGALALSLRAKTWNHAMLHTELTGKANVFDETLIKPGDTGKAVSRLVPMGKAYFNGDYYEVRSSGEFIDQETELIVTKIEFNKIFVKQKI